MGDIADLLEAAAVLRKQIAAGVAAQQVVADVVVAPMIRSGSLDDAQVAAASAVFPEWEPGVAVKVGDLLRWDGTVVEVVQAHKTQADWTPDKTPALFTVHRTPEQTEWQAGIDVTAGERFTFQGKTFEVVQAHRTQQGWEPPNVPALWKQA